MKCLALIVLLIISGVPSAFARPVYAIETGKPCAYCHLDPKGGGPRNKRGLYFAANKHSFKGYDEIAVMGRFSPPLLTQGWKETLPASVRKVGVGDTAGDGSLRLVTLSDGASNTVRNLSIKKWDGKAWASEFTKDVPASSDRLAVGKYAGSDRPAVIVTSGSLIYREGADYRVVASARPTGVLGTVQLKTGAERLLINEANTVRMVRVDPSKGDAWLTGAMDPPASAETSFSEMKAPTSELQSIGLPDLLANGEIIGLWDARKADAVFFYAVKLVPILESKGGGEEKDVNQAVKNLVLKGQNYHLTIVDPRSDGFKVLWQTEVLDGKVHDVTIHDPRTGDRGLTILTESDSGKAKTLYFYKLL